MPGNAEIKRDSGTGCQNMPESTSSEPGHAHQQITFPLNYAAYSTSYYCSFALRYDLNGTDRTLDHVIVSTIDITNSCRVCMSMLVCTRPCDSPGWLIGFFLGSLA